MQHLFTKGHNFSSRLEIELVFRHGIHIGEGKCFPALKVGNQVVNSDQSARQVLPLATKLASARYMAAELDLRISVEVISRPLLTGFASSPRYNAAEVTRVVDLAMRIARASAMASSQAQPKRVSGST